MAFVTTSEFVYIPATCDGLTMPAQTGYRVYSPERPFVSVDALEDLAIEHAEHRAYNECIQFEGDSCWTCTKYDMDRAAITSAVQTLDCDGCGRQTPLATHPRDLVIVLCADCNGGYRVS